MEIRPSEISEILKQQIQGLDERVEVRETGTVLSTGDGIARIYGLDSAAAGELLQFPHDLYGLVLNLEEDHVGAAIFGEAQMVSEGMEVRRTGRIAEVPQFNQITIASRQGYPIKVADIGYAEDSYEEPRSAARFDGSPAVTLVVAKQRSLRFGIQRSGKRARAPSMRPRHSS